MALSKRSARELLEKIEEYADAKAEQYWMDDQGTGPGVDRARAETVRTKKDLLKALGLKREGS